MCVWGGERALERSPLGRGEVGWRGWVASKAPVGEARRSLFSAPRINRPQGENECVQPAAAEEVEEIREGCPGGAGWVEGGAR